MLGLVLALLAQAPPQVELEPYGWQGLPGSNGALFQLCPDNSCPATLAGANGEAMSFSRASASTCQNQDDSVTTLASNQPCLPKASASSGSGLGVNLFGGVTNLLEYSDAIANSPWAISSANTGGTCPSPVVFGSDGGAEFADPYGTFTATKVVFSSCSGASNAGAIYQGPISASQNWHTLSTYVRTGSGLCAQYIAAFDNTTGGVTVPILFTADAGWSRQFAATPANLSDAMYDQIGTSLTISGESATTGCTLYLSGAQAEANRYPSRLCQSLGSTATCAAETLSKSTAVSGLSTSNFCASVQLVPDSNAFFADAGILSTGTYGAANSWSLWTQQTSGNADESNYWFDTFDSVGTKREWGATAYAQAGVPYGLTLQFVNGTPTLYWQGTALTWGSTPSGTPTFTSQLAPNIAWEGAASTQAIGTEENITVGNAQTCPVWTPSSLVDCLGDSITYGYLPNNLGRMNSPWPAIMQQALGQQSWAVTNDGISGQTCVQMLSRVANAELAGRHRVILLCGVNDNIGGATAATIYSNIQSIVSGVKATGASVTLLTNTPWSNYSSWSSAKQTVTTTLNSSISGTAGVTVVDAYTLLGGGGTSLLSQYDSGDGLHPNQAGAQAIATAVLASGL